MTGRPVPWRALTACISAAIAAAYLSACGGSTSNVPASAGTIPASASAGLPSSSASATPSELAAYGPIGLPAIPNATIVPYAIQGATGAELRAQMNAIAPHHFDAYTQWNFQWHWPTTSDGTCILAQATVDYQITISAPVWTPPASVNPTLVTEWRAYMVALATHEKGHVDFVVATVPSVLTALHGATCATANAAAQAVLDRIRKHDIDYDAATHHGATQGAVFPPKALGGGG